MNWEDSALLRRRGTPEWDKGRWLEAGGVVRRLGDITPGPAFKPWLWLLVVWLNAAGADCPDPETVLSLMHGADPVLQAERDEYHALAEKPSWRVEVGAGWTLNGTDYGGSSGPNAGLRVSVPLFDPSTGLEKAKARSALAKAEDSRAQAMLSELEKLCGQAAELSALDETRRLYRDRLRWRQQRVDEGYDKPQSLWEDTEALVKTEQAWKKTKQTLNGLRERLARTYGGERWAELKRVLEH